MSAKKINNNYVPKWYIVKKLHSAPANDGQTITKGTYSLPAANAACNKYNTERTEDEQKIFFYALANY